MTDYLSEDHSLNTIGGKFSLRPLFGVPTYRGMIDSSSYNKQKIIEDIEYNYHLDPNRNCWDNDHILASDMHHVYKDTKNSKFRIINFDSLLPQYLYHVQGFVNEFNFWRPFKFNFEIVNYTCMGKGQHMREHIHPDSDFVAIHYLKFDETHPPTTFINPAHWRHYTDAVFSKTLTSSVNDMLENSWLKEYYSFYVKEDELIIWPATLSHTINKSPSDDLRMTIALNIRLSEIDTIEKFPDKYK